MWEAFVTLNIVMILFMIGWCLLWLWSLIDILSSTFDDTMVKVIWLLVILFLPLIGAILYLLIGRTMKESATSPSQDPYTRIAQLKELLDDGAITQEEFETEKKKILDHP